MYDPNLCDLCQEQAKHPSGILPGDLAPIHVCLDCRRYVIAERGPVIQGMGSEEQDQFESVMIPLGRAVSRVRRNFA